MFYVIVGPPGKRNDVQDGKESWAEVDEEVRLMPIVQRHRNN